MITFKSIREGGCFLSFIKINPMKGLLGLHIRIQALHRLEIEDCDSSRHRVPEILIGRSLSKG